MVQRENVTRLTTAADLKKHIEDLREELRAMEHFFYGILDSSTLLEAKEIAADAVHEDLEVYLEMDEDEDEQVEELDFNDDGKVPWKEIDDQEKED